MPVGMPEEACCRSVGGVDCRAAAYRRSSSDNHAQLSGLQQGLVVLCELPGDVRPVEMLYRALAQPLAGPSLCDRCRLILWEQCLPEAPGEAAGITCCSEDAVRPQELP